MERSEIEAFLALAEELHFGRAADRLGFSTGWISQTIQRLERRIGARLFDRTSRRVTLSTIGVRFHDDLRPGYQQVQYALERAIKAARGFDDPLRVGFLGASAGQFVLEAARVYRAAHPRSEVHIQELQMHDCISGLREGAVEMVLNTRPLAEADLATGPVLWSEPRYLAVSTGHPLAGRDEISLEDLAGVTLLRMPDNAPASISDDRVPSRTPGGKPIAHGPPVSTFMEVLGLVGADEGAFTVDGQVTRFYLRPDVTYVPFGDAAPIEWGFVWRRADETARIRDFNERAVLLSRSFSWL
ncbi:LysR substrate-binding domain-containing protein [Streptomyces sp. P1-3]|uniref:LysR substrate-binding domain-containing protein n=1 Tax=Streptomyces sp. P1-3 TaxID=3421658 RepID=UPI003D36FD33